jgi:hypothetical protein
MDGHSAMDGNLELYLESLRLDIHVDRYSRDHHIHIILLTLQ